MSISVVEIVNLALARLGESPIQSLDEGTVPANMAKVFYDPARRAALREYTWNFALKVATLAELDETPNDFRHAFSLPSDCLKVLRLRFSDAPDFTPRRGPAFTVRSGQLLTNESPARLEYICDEQDPDNFDDTFIEALSYKLASDLAMPVKGSSEMMGNYMSAYQSLSSRAAENSADEENESVPDNPYLQARF